MTTETQHAPPERQRVRVSRLAEYIGGVLHYVPDAITVIEPADNTLDQLHTDLTAARAERDQLRERLAAIGPAIIHTFDTIAPRLKQLVDQLDTGDDEPAAPAPVAGDLRPLRKELGWAIHGALCSPCNPDDPANMVISNEAMQKAAYAALSVVRPWLGAKQARIQELGEQDQRRQRDLSIARRERDEARAEVERLRGEVVPPWRVGELTPGEVHSGTPGVVQLSALADGISASRWISREAIDGAIPNVVAAVASELVAAVLADDWCAPVSSAEPEQPVSLDDLVMPVDPFEAAKRAYYAWARSTTVGTDIEIESWEDHVRLVPSSGEAWVAVAVAVLEGVPLPAVPVQAQPREWTAGDPEPTDSPKVTDAHGDAWTRNAAGVWESPGTMPCSWAYLLKKWPPLTEVVEQAPARPQCVFSATCVGGCQTGTCQVRVFDMADGTRSCNATVLASGYCGAGHRPQPSAISHHHVEQATAGQDGQ